MAYITEDFKLSERNTNYLKKFHSPFGYNGLGELVYYRTYSRCIDGKQETFDDTVARVINGTFSIFNTKLINKEELTDKNHELYYTDKWQQRYATKFGQYIKEFKFTPPGRGLWSMGTDLIKERGSAPLYNCAACCTKDLAVSMSWAMLMLMNGVGVGFDTTWSGTAKQPTTIMVYDIPDTREGWAESVKLLIEAYTCDKPMPFFNYTDIRPEGTPIVGFGGIASGFAPLNKLHARIINFFTRFINGDVTHTRLTADIANAIGCCVIAGNVRRSAEILISPASGEGSDLNTFLNLKNADVNPERQDLAWASNNSIGMYKEEDYDLVERIVSHVVSNGEPGIINFVNVQKYGRYGEESPDKATLTNPCGEIALESYETCNLADVNLSNCESEDEIYQAMEFAAFYCTVVSSLPTHSELTNKIIEKNHRIGVSVSGVVEAYKKYGKEKFIQILDTGYQRVKQINHLFGKLLGFKNTSIRLTTVKPAGTTSLLAGVTPGAHYPPYNYAARRIRIAHTQPIAKILIEAGVKYEQCVYSESSWCFTFYYKKDNVRSATDVSIEEQFEIMKILQKYWADNMISVTVYFNAEEAKRLAQVTKEYLPYIKCVSMLPHSEKGVWKQPPYEGICRAEYLKQVYGDLPEDHPEVDLNDLTAITEEEYIKATKGEYDELVHAHGGYSSCKFDWGQLTDSQGIDEKYCSGASCEV
tara:strand:+ start:45416 stop:47521 length:2106 start_codon:yes stop_codon:yes gene_type:complete